MSGAGAALWRFVGPVCDANRPSLGRPKFVREKASVLLTASPARVWAYACGFTALRLAAEIACNRKVQKIWKTRHSI